MKITKPKKLLGYSMKASKPPNSREPFLTSDGWITNGSIAVRKDRCNYTQYSNLEKKDIAAETLLKEVQWLRLHAIEPMGVYALDTNRNLMEYWSYAERDQTEAFTAIDCDYHFDNCYYSMAPDPLSMILVTTVNQLPFSATNVAAVVMPFNPMHLYRRV